MATKRCRTEDAAAPECLEVAASLPECLERHRSVCGAEEMSSSADLQPLWPPLMLLSSNHSAKRRLTLLLEEELAASVFEYKCSSEDKDQCHQLIPFSVPDPEPQAPHHDASARVADGHALTDEAMARLISDWRLWDGARPAHNLHVLTHIARTWPVAIQCATKLAAAAHSLSTEGTNDAVGALRMTAHPKKLVEKLVNDLPLTVELHPKNFTHVLHTVALPGGWFGLGVVKREWYPPAGPIPTAAGASSEAATAQPVSRAFFKMKEAATHVRWSPLIWRGQTSVGRALDLGAAPGGWTQWLATEGAAELVVAVDPGALGAAVTELQNVRHVPLKIEVAVADGQLEGKFGLVVCDMNIHPEASAKAITSLMPW